MAAAGSAEELEEYLANIQAAINALLKGAQSYRLGDRSVTRANLTELRKTRRELLNELQQLNGTRPKVSHVDLRGNFSRGGSDGTGV